MKRKTLKTHTHTLTNTKKMKRKKISPQGNIDEVNHKVKKFKKNGKKTKKN